MKDLKTEGYLISRTAKIYDFFGGSRRRARRVLMVLRPEERENVLDVGCGTGELACVIAKIVGEKGAVSGIDPSAEMLGVAKRKAEKLKLKIDFRLSAIEKLPFGSGTFDKVYSTLMTHHLPVKVKKLGFKEVRRVLKQGGKFLVVDFGPPTNVFIKLIAFPILFLEKYFFSKSDALGSNLRGEIPVLLKQAGFSEVRVIKRELGFLEYILAE